MFRWAERIPYALLAMCCYAEVGAGAEKPQDGMRGELGRAATASEIAAWDIDVRPDFTGLPSGSGTVQKGEEIWFSQCAACHGDFGDANNYFSPLVLGNVTDEDMETGRVAALRDPTRVRTTLMKLSTVSTLWDYIYRAMPWNNPKSLDADAVYSVLAYLLNLAYIIEEDFVLDQNSIHEAQTRMPNRNGMTNEHGLWKVDGKPDVSPSQCMKECSDVPKITSDIPAFARSSHGDLRLQNREFGPFRGISSPDNVVNKVAATVVLSPGEHLVTVKGCAGCHKLDERMVGPTLYDIADKYRTVENSMGYLAQSIQAGSSGVWGGVMPPQPSVSADDAETIAGWLLSLPVQKK